jgi:sugar PTS system EIIA component
MLKGLFHKKVSTRVEEILSPMEGDVIELAAVPDPVFAQKMMGDGVAIIPTSGKVTSPVNGHIVQVFPTKHAIGIQSENGLEILIHIGLETVELNGEGFEVLVSNHQPIKAGETLVNVNLDYLKSSMKEIVTPVIITNMDSVLTVEPCPLQKATRGEVLMRCTLK